MKKNADSRLLTPWMFFVLALIGVAIVAAVVVYFSASTDIRIKEAKTISDKLVHAISDNGYINEEILSGGIDFLSEADINKNSMDSYGLYYFNVTISKNNKTVKSFIFGNIDFEIQCRLNGDKLAKCYERELVLLDKSNPSEVYQIKILSGSNNQGS
jgi:hypothetical protein